MMGQMTRFFGKIGIVAGAMAVILASAGCANLPNTTPSQAPVTTQTTTTTAQSYAPYDFAILSPMVQAYLYSQAGQAYDVALRDEFIRFVNHHHLVGHDGARLQLNADGTGSFLDEYKYWLNLAVNMAYHQGGDLHAYEFLAQKKDKNPYYIDDFQGFINKQVTMTSCTAPDRCTAAPVISKLTQNGNSAWLIRDGARYDHALMAMIIAAKLRADGKRVNFGLFW